MRRSKIGSKLRNAGLWIGVVALGSTLAATGEANSPAASSSADPLNDLTRALAGFRGVGYADVASYRVPIHLPGEDSASSADLEEIWRAPRDLVLRSRDDGTPGAVVRSLAIYLEPLYVARTAILDLDWNEIAGDVRTLGTIRSREDSRGKTISVGLPDSSRARLPEALGDVAHLEAGLDARGRLRVLEVELDSGEIVSVSCDYASRDALQPADARWTLPSGEIVQVRTKFRRSAGRLLPSERQVVFPSRFDPNETEEILVEYGAYELDPSIPDSIWTARGSFRFDANGLVN
jgi:hypothetical protein